MPGARLRVEKTAANTCRRDRPAYRCCETRLIRVSSHTAYSKIRSATILPLARHSLRLPVPDDPKDANEQTGGMGLCLVLANAWKGSIQEKGSPPRDF